MDANQMKLIEQLKKQASSDAEAMSAYMRHKFPFIGIKSVARRSFYRPYIKEVKARARHTIKLNPGAQIIDWDFVSRLWELPQREFQYVAADYLKDLKIYLKKEDLAKLKELIISKSWWDSVDALVKTVGFLAQKYPDLKDQLIEWSLSDNIWLRRAAIINQLNMKEATDTELLRRTIENNLQEEEFFINKAIGWALRDYSKTQPEWVEAFIGQHYGHLAPLSLREASKYLTISESSL